MKFVCSLAIGAVTILTATAAVAADWRPMPETEGVEGRWLYDAQSVKRQDDKVYVKQRNYLSDNGLANYRRAGRDGMLPGAYMNYNLILECRQRRVYESRVTWHDPHGRQTAWIDHSDQPSAPWNSVDAMPFSGKPHTSLGLFKLLCSSKGRS